MAPAEWSVEEVAGFRRFMREVLHTDAEFEAFCIDCFRSIHGLHFSSGMDRMQKENLLFQYSSLSEVRENLAQWRIHLQMDEELPREHAHSSARLSLSRNLQELYDRKEQLLLSGQEVGDLDAQILSVRRDQRHGPSLHHGEVLGDRFVLDRTIGHGGFACVWRAYDRQVRNMVAVKVLHGQWSADTSRIERFYRGARRMAELHHPAVVRVVVPAQEDSGFHFFATEYLAAGDLRTALLSRQLSEGQALDALIQVGEALHYAHARKFIHRDIKPSNILLDDSQQARIGDFDLVYVPDSTGGTRTTALGSVFYAAPEAMENAKLVDCPTSDIYSLGMTLVFIIYGNDLPQQAWTERKTFWRELRCSASLRAVVERATAPAPQARYQTAIEFCEALRVAIAKAEIAPHNRNRSARFLAGLSQRERLTGGAAAIAITVALTLWGLVMKARSPTATAPPLVVMSQRPSGQPSLSAAEQLPAAHLVGPWPPVPAASRASSALKVVRKHREPLREKIVRSAKQDEEEDVQLVDLHD